ncbi:MAG TPA: sigma-54-dependent Fis family transcriptional regulator [Acidobacteria bacterium]|nr:sigma-54-dependent Fis family transcriptional regulator [Acidobacteriota bacterium]
MKRPAILVVDDDRAFRELVVDILASEGYELLEASDAERALEILAGRSVDLVISDQRMPGMDGVELTRRIRSGSNPPEVIVMTAYGTIQQAVEAVRRGAADYITKPLESPAVLRQLIRRVLGERGSDAPSSGEFLTRDPRTLELLALADRAAVTDATVLIVGESGSGKELLARRIHRKSRRSAGPFVAINCAAIPENLAESELFGHERGAFTGASQRRTGRFEQAHGGTLFMDEIGELPESVQAKLLRALEERSIERVGGSRPVEVDLRLVAATNRDLEREVEAGRFRKDLFFRLDVVRLEIPPLRDRKGDLELLIPALIEDACRRVGVPVKPISKPALEMLHRHTWPGNVRELRNVLERALISATGEAIQPGDLPELSGAIAENTRPPDGTTPLSLEDREKTAILEALERTGGHREKAARLLGISVRTLYNRLRRYGIR